MEQRRSRSRERPSKFDSSPEKSTVPRRPKVGERKSNFSEKPPSAEEI